MTSSRPQSLSRFLSLSLCLSLTLSLSLSLFSTPSSSHAASIKINDWQPLFQGIDLASGQQIPASNAEILQQVLCLRIDLSQPGIQLFTTPACTNCPLETLAENTSHFLEQWDTQVAINGAFYSSSFGPNDVPLGSAEDVHGLAISQGTLVSPADESSYDAVFLFSSNNVPSLVPNATTTTPLQGVYTAISGNHVLLQNGVNQQTANPRDLDPRTAIGISQDKRYLFLLTIDGRQDGWSEGSDFFNTGEWLKRFGAYDAINIDGGGSTTMVTSDCRGSAVRLNRSSFVAAYGRERRIGHNFGVRALPLPAELSNLSILTDSTTALLTWTTPEPSTTQVQYGTTASYEFTSPLQTNLTRTHVVTLSGLASSQSYFFKAQSITANNQSLSQACQFTTTSANAGSISPLFDLTQIWSYNNTSLDGIPWTANNYPETGWLGSGPGLLHVENNSQVSPKNTELPPGFGSIIPRTYYFRTHFSFQGNPSTTSLVFSNYIDDGAVFHLNGSEIYRLRLPAKPTLINSSTAANALPCSGTVQAGDAATICPDVFTLTPAELPTLIQGDNVLAVEVHNYTSGNDLVFGSALSAINLVKAPPQLYSWLEDSSLTLFWLGSGFLLQESSSLDPNATWSTVTTGNLTGPQQRSFPLSASSPTPRFYRLSQ